MSRDQKRARHAARRSGDGPSTLLFTETSPTWVNLNDNFKPLKDGSLIWTSERSGHSHLYRWQAGQWTQLTHGDWAVRKTLRASMNAQAASISPATAETPTRAALYWVGYRRPGAPRGVTETGWWNSAAMDKGATHALVTRSNPGQPSQTYLADAAGKRLAVDRGKCGLNAAHPYAPYLAGHVQPTFGTLLAADGTAALLPDAVAAPRSPGKRYPVFFYVYGGRTASR